MVMLVMGILAGIGVPRYRLMKEKAFVASMKSDLGALRTAQEAFFTENQEYALDITRLEYKPTTSVTITLSANDPFTGYQATATHAIVPTVCTTATGLSDTASTSVSCTAPMSSPSAASTKII